MKTNEPINLMSFRNDALRSHNTGVERQFKMALGLVGLLCAATAAAFLTFQMPQPSGAAPGQTASGKSISVDRG